MIYIEIFIIICLIIFLLVFYSTWSEMSITNKVKVNNVLVAANELKNDKIIWSYWDDVEQPLTVKIALYSWHKHNKDYKILMLNKNNIGDYINMETLPKKYHEVSIQKQSDIIRLALLEKYGGVWLDSTIYLNQSLNIEWTNDYDIGGYCAEFYTTDKDHPVFESWFISAPKGSKLIKAWKDEFFKAIDMDHDLYIKELEKKVNLQNIDGKVYLLIHCCFIKVINEEKWNWKMLPAGEKNGPLTYIAENNWNPLAAVIHLLTYNDRSPIIKVRYPERLIMNKCIYFMLSNSTMYNIIYN